MEQRAQTSLKRPRLNRTWRLFLVAIVVTIACSVLLIGSFAYVRWSRVSQIVPLSPGLALCDPRTQICRSNFKDLHEIARFQPRGTRQIAQIKFMRSGEVLVVYDDRTGLRRSGHAEVIRWSWKEASMQASRVVELDAKSQISIDSSGDHLIVTNEGAATSDTFSTLSYHADVYSARTLELSAQIGVNWPSVVLRPGSNPLAAFSFAESYLGDVYMSPEHDWVSNADRLGSIQSVTFDPTGDYLAVAYIPGRIQLSAYQQGLDLNPIVEFRNPAYANPIREEDHKLFMQQVHFDPGRTRIAASFPDHLAIWRIAALTDVPENTIEWRSPGRFDFNPTGDIIALISGNSLEMRDMTTADRAMISFDDPLGDVAFASDGSLVLVGDSRGWIHVLGP